MLTFPRDGTREATDAALAAIDAVRKAKASNAEAQRREASAHAARMGDTTPPKESSKQ